METVDPHRTLPEAEAFLGKDEHDQKSCINQQLRPEKSGPSRYTSLSNTSLGRDNSLGWEKSENRGLDSSLGWEKEKT